MVAPVSNGSLRTLRAPSKHTTASSTAPETPSEAPSPEFMTATWHVCYSTLPMWKKKTDVRITYTAIPNSPHYDDLVQSKKKSNGKDTFLIKGVSQSAKLPIGDGWAFTWKGKGWLSVAGSSKWEVLGWGKEPDGNKWIVTFFDKTLATPPGIDICSESIAGVTKTTLDSIKNDLKTMDHHLPGASYSMRTLANGLFEVLRQDREKISSVASSIAVDGR